MLTENVLFDESSQSRMEKFERKLFPDKRKHYRCRAKFDCNAYTEFTHSDLYAQVNQELKLINEKRRELVSSLYKNFPVGEKHHWVEEDGVFVAQIREEYLLDD